MVLKYKMKLAAHPIKERPHLVRDKLWRRCHENADVTIENSLVVCAEDARLLYGEVSHDAVKLLKVSEGEGIELPKHVIRLVGVLDFLDFFCRSNYCFPVDDAFNLIQGEGIRLNRQGRVNGTDTVVAPQMRLCLKRTVACDSTGLFGNLRHQSQHCVCDGKRRRVLFHWCCTSLSASL